MARLIDADALIAPLKLRMESYDRIGAHEKAETIRNCLWEISEAPTIDAAPVVHGRWKPDMAFGNDIMSGRMVLCSRCGKGVMTGPVPYCPWCGALMQEDK